MFLAFRDVPMYVLAFRDVPMYVLVFRDVPMCSTRCVLFWIEKLLPNTTVRRTISVLH